MTDKITPPWTPEEVEVLNRWQTCGWVHPFTCPREHPGADDHVALIASDDGWYCPWEDCEYTQNWAHRMMLDVPPNPFAGMEPTSGPCPSCEHDLFGHDYQGRCRHLGCRCGAIVPERAGREGDTQPLPHASDTPIMHHLVQQDLEDRLRLGIKRYGQPLQAFNGRDALADLYSEILDAAVYCRQLMWERDHAQG